jgi:hypothetical protein
MGSQTASAVSGVIALALAAGCGKPENPTISPISLPEDAPDLSLRGVAFARLSEGRVVSRGTAEQLDYRRSGGRMRASYGAATIYPQPGTNLASLGVTRFIATRIEGEVPAKRGTASAGVRLDAVRGDTARTDQVHLDGDVLHTDTRVVARGPGYQVDGNGLFARTDGSVIQFTGGVTGQLAAGQR